MPAYVKFRIPEWLDWLFTWPLMLWRRFKYGRPFRRIYLGENEWTKVDPDVYYRLGHLNWCLSGNGSKFYAARFIKVGPGKTKIIRLHREIMDPPAGLLVDHRNTYTFDNLRHNLRFATRSENMYNKGKTKSKTSSKYVGVCYDKSRRKWESRIYCTGRKIWLGRFDDEISAAKAYDQAAKKYHGEFARLNFPCHK